jgi:hypothetical protein
MVRERLFMKSIDSAQATWNQGKSDRRGLRVLFLVLLMGMMCVGTERYGAAADNRAASPAPVLLELFTSEGCSTCPPADAFLQTMDSSQPIPGARLIVLSEHVDYWDHDGWKDPYSSHLLTDRQSDYDRNLRLSTPYTPQIIVDGTQVLRGGPQQVQQLLTEAAAAPKLSVRVGSVVVEPGSSEKVRAHVDVTGAPGKHGAEIFVALALDHAESQVLHGENSGKHLTHVAVVEEIKKIGKIEKEESFSKDVQLSLKRGSDAKNLRVIAFVQEPGPGKVLGAAMQRP